MTSATAKYHDMLNSVREFMKLHEVITRSGVCMQELVQGGGNSLCSVQGGSAPEPKNSLKIIDLTDPGGLNPHRTLV